MTLLIEATKYGHLKIIKHMLGKCNIDVNATGKIKHFGTLVEGATALWLAAGQYNILNCRKSLLYRYSFQ